MKNRSAQCETNAHEYCSSLIIINEVEHGECECDCHVAIAPEVDEELPFIEDELFTMTREEVNSLLDECRHSWISYENPRAKILIQRMRIWSES